MEQRLAAFKEESKDFWAKEQITPPATVEQQLRVIRETWMTSQKRVAKLEQLQDSILKKERHLVQLKQDTTEVREELQVAISPLGITTVEEFRTQLPTLDNRVALAQKRAYIEKQVTIFTNEEKESLQRQTLEESAKESVY